jgi:UDP-glucose 4-epimerase
MHGPVLVIGGSGFLGQHVVRLLSEADRPVYATRHATRETPDGEHIRWISCDLTSATATEHWPTNCETVVFLAQGRKHRQFPEGASEVFGVNVEGIFRSVEYARRAGAKRFVYVSTGSVYGPGTRPLAETDPIDIASANRSFYPATKLAGEILLQPYRRLLPIVTLRLFVPYGPGQPADMLMPQLAAKVQSGQPIFLNGAEGLWANPVYAEDVAETIRRAMSLNESATLNVAGPEPVSLRSIGQTLSKVLARPVEFASQEGEPPYLVGDVSALKKTLGWAPPTGLEAGLRRWLGSRIATARA